MSSFWSVAVNLQSLELNVAAYCHQHPETLSGLLACKSLCIRGLTNQWEVAYPPILSSLDLSLSGTTNPCEVFHVFVSCIRYNLAGYGIHLVKEDVHQQGALQTLSCLKLDCPCLSYHRFFRRHSEHLRTNADEQSAGRGKSLGVVCSESHSARVRRTTSHVERNIATVRSLENCDHQTLQ